MNAIKVSFLLGLLGGILFGFISQGSDVGLGHTLQDYKMLIVTCIWVACSLLWGWSISKVMESLATNE